VADKRLAEEAGRRVSAIEAESKRMAAELETARGSVKSLQSQLSQNQTTQDKLTIAEGECGRLRLLNSSLTAEISQLKARERHEASREELENEIKDLREQIVTIRKDAYDKERVAKGVRFFFCFRCVWVFVFMLAITDQ
jgi:hypothetical protein